MHEAGIAKANASGIAVCFLIAAFPTVAHNFAVGRRGEFNLTCS
jgi:hypothetical protein